MSFAVHAGARSPTDLRARRRADRARASSRTCRWCAQVARVHRRRRRQAAAAGAAAARLRRARLSRRGAPARSRRWSSSSTPPRCCTTTWSTSRTLRRGRSTANAAFGNAAAVLVGDFLYSRAFQMMVEVDDMRVMQVLAEATNTIADGEVLQLMGSHDPDGRRGALPRGDPPQDREAVRGRRRASAPCWRGAARRSRTALARLRRARRHRVPADRRRARLLGRRADDRQEPRRRPRRGQADAAAHPRACAAARAEQAALVRQAIVDGGREDFGAVLARDPRERRARLRARGGASAKPTPRGARSRRCRRRNSSDLC